MESSRLLLATTTVSIILPVYNGEPFIAEAIQSVVDQRYPDWELIIVDDGSTDRTRDVVDGFRDERIRYAYQANRGQAAALNRGLELAQGTYVTTLDADDWLTENSLSDRVEYLEQHRGAGAVYADGYFCDVSGAPIQRFSEYYPREAIGDVYEALVVSCFLGTGASVMIRRDVLDQHQLRYDETIDWCQDWDFYIRVAAHTTYGAMDAITVRYRIHGANMSVAMPQGRRLESLIRTRLKVLDSDRFATTSAAAKSAFFYCLLVDDLAGRPEQQAAVVNGRQFRTMPPRDRARLLRLIAADALLRGDRPAAARAWLGMARSLAPWDPKSTLLSVAATVSTRVAKRLVMARRTWRPRPAPASPFAPVGVSR